MEVSVGSIEAESLRCSEHARGTLGKGNHAMDTTNTPAYHAYAYNVRVPLAEQLEDALTTFQTRTGQTPRGVVVPVAVVAEAQAARPELVVEGQTWVQPGNVYVR